MFAETIAAIACEAAEAVKKAQEQEEYNYAIIHRRRVDIGGFIPVNKTRYGYEISKKSENESHLRVNEDLRDLKREIPEIVREF